MIEKFMVKLYLFYLISDITDVRLYAFTTDREVMKEFMSTRNMNIFYLKKVIIKDKNEWNYFMRENLMKEIIIYDLKTKSDKNHTTKTMLTMPIVKGEWHRIKSGEYLIYSSIYKYVKDPYIFIDKYSNA